MAQFDRNRWHGHSEIARPGKQKSFVILDEAPTIYIPKLEVLPATGRSNKIAMVYIAQDFAQITDSYGKEKSDVIIANLSNQFFGKTSSLPTAKFVSELIGKEDKEMESRSIGNNKSINGYLNRSLGRNINYQERYLIRPQDVAGLAVGEFVGQTVETQRPYFWDKLKIKEEDKNLPLYGFSDFCLTKSIDDDFNKKFLNGGISQEIVEANFYKIKREVEFIINKYKNVYQ